MNLPIQSIAQHTDFGHIKEFYRLKNATVRLGDWPLQMWQGLQILCILEGRFEWLIQNERHILYPNDVLVLCPWHLFGSPTATLEIGSFAWLSIQPIVLEENTEFKLGDWSALSEGDQRIMGRLLSVHTPMVISNLKQVYEIIQRIETEIKHAEFAFSMRTNQLIDELLVLLVRQLSQHQNQRRDFSQAFVALEQLLRQSLDHPWTVEEMATTVGMGTTAFTEKVKAYSGFSPLNYLINIRIAEAMKQIKQTHKSLTDIALDMGFYSSQHFSTTFKKLTGYTPGHFRKKNP